MLKKSVVRSGVTSAARTLAGIIVGISSSRLTGELPIWVG